MPARIFFSLVFGIEIFNWVVPPGQMSRLGIMKFSETACLTHSVSADDDELISDEEEIGF